MMLPTTMRAVTMPAEAYRPTFSIMGGNLVRDTLNQYEMPGIFVEIERERAYQKGPIKPQVCLTKVMNTPTDAASSR
jgi:hypothetical protein